MMPPSLAWCRRWGLIGAWPIHFKRTAAGPCVFFCRAEPMLGCFPGAAAEHGLGSTTARQRIGTSEAWRRYSAGNCLPSAASFGAS